MVEIRAPASPPPGRRAIRGAIRGILTSMSQSRATVRTMCPMNCHPTLCGMLVDIEDGRVVGIRGDRDNPDSEGFLCIRGQASAEIFDNPKRLLHPIVRARRTDDWRRASWDEALDLIVGRMRAAGRQAVATWAGHGLFANNYGTRIHSHLLRRFSNLYGCQWWNPTMICWGLGAFGLGLTGALEVNTKEDMGAHSELIVMWGANIASQPNTGRYLTAARRRGARVVTIDVRVTESAAQADEVFVIRPGSDAALALALMHVIVGEGLYNRDFVARHTIGCDQLAAHVRQYSPEWAAPVTGIDAGRIRTFARSYAKTTPAMILLGGSSMFKGSNGWYAARAVGCLPALTGNLGIAGGGFGPRHGAATHGQALETIAAPDRRLAGEYIPNQMSRITEALLARQVRALLLFGTDMLSSFADAGRVADGLARMDLVMSHDLFLNDTARRFADVVLPATAWLEELGCKSTNTHLYLMPMALDPPGECRSPIWVLRALAERLEIDDFFPWQGVEGPLDAILDHPSTGHATVAALRAGDGIRPLRVSHIAHPDLAFPTPSGKIEFHSERAAALGLPALPIHEDLPRSTYPLVLRQGRTLTQFHGFYDHGRALPTLARIDPEPLLWISPFDAAARGIEDATSIRLYNERGTMSARAHVTTRVPAGTVWMRDGWEGLNTLTSGAACLPDHAVDAVGPFSGGQATFDASVEVAPP
jgi:anaerobic selenocysteine-containing dehydrogenase